MQTVLEVVADLKSERTFCIHTAQEMVAFPYPAFIKHRIVVPEPYQAIESTWHKHETFRGWPQTTILGRPHFNILRTNPLWR